MARQNGRTTGKPLVMLLNPHVYKYKNSISLGLGYLSSSLKRAGYRTIMVNQFEASPLRSFFNKSWAFVNRNVFEQIRSKQRSITIPL